jgi:L-ornithine N5-monooxygenase
MTVIPLVEHAPAPTADEPSRILDVLGIGFGPSNLALAIALEEMGTGVAGQRPVDAAFIEQQDRFGWHRGMLLEGADLQVTFLKDLVTMRDPTSDFSFLCYLQQAGRLPAFISQKSWYPSRVEYHDYLVWAAGRLRHRVSYGVQAVDARPVIRDGDVPYIDVTARRMADGHQIRYRTRNIVVAIGLAPRLPRDAPASRRVLHSSSFLHRIGQVPADPGQTFVVVGAGQSGAEIVEYLHRNYPKSQVHAVFARYSYSPIDDTYFVNGIFNPEAVDLYYNAPDEVKELLANYHSNTNLSVVDSDLIAALGRREYEELVAGEQRLIIHNLSRLAGVQETESGLDIQIAYLPGQSVSTVHADWLIYATGYQPRSPLGVLGEIGTYCKPRPDGSVRLNRSYRIITEERMHCGIYVQGAGEASHGPSSPLLSLNAVRAGEIADSIIADLDVASEPQ